MHFGHFLGGAMGSGRSGGEKRMSFRRAIAIPVALLLGACAVLQNTPQQDIVWAAYNGCKAEGRIPSNIQLIRVEPDGRAWYSTYSSAYGAQELERCIADKTSSGSAGVPPPTAASLLSPAVSCPGDTYWNGNVCTTP
jgi:hypothetical protein